MILAQHGRIASAMLRKDVYGVRRVMIARADGLAFHDDASLEEREAGAAAVAAVLGLNAGVAGSLDLGALRSTVLVGDRGFLMVRPLDGMHLLAVTVDPGADLSALDASMARFAALIDQSHERAAAEARAREEALRASQVRVEGVAIPRLVPDESALDAALAARIGAAS